MFVFFLLDIHFCLNRHLRICLLILERKGGREGGRGTERERNINVREKHPSVACRRCPRPGMGPAAFWHTGRCYNQLSYRISNHLCFKSSLSARYL